ncbi:hypothetical protein V6N13_106257 [Hibiscus sabdariffa]|uniref:Uncharacterized protein n=1 Tax=Hibiscus sabdariffa TaxID=183260 RepID=A0ABR2F035_9ROSI
MQHAPAWDAVVSPASKLVGDEGNPPAYRAMEYKEYLELNQSNVLDRKSCLEQAALQILAALPLLAKKDALQVSMIAFIMLSRTPLLVT